MAPFSRNDTLPDEKSSLIENSIFSPEEESALINKPKLILLGENHMFSSGPALLKQISAEYSSLLFLEIHNKFHIHRLYNAHVNPDDPAENEKRKNILGNLTFNYPDTFCVDMDYQSKYYMNEGMRDHCIISNINKIFNAQNEKNATPRCGTLLIGYSHIENLWNQLEKNFDILVLIPSDDESISAYIGLEKLCAKHPGDVIRYTGKTLMMY